MPPSNSRILEREAAVRTVLLALTGLFRRAATIIFQSESAIIFLSDRRNFPAPPLCGAAAPCQDGGGP